MIYAGLPILFIWEKQMISLAYNSPFDLYNALWLFYNNLAKEDFDKAVSLGVDIDGLKLSNPILELINYEDFSELLRQLEGTQQQALLYWFTLAPESKTYLKLTHFNEKKRHKQSFDTWLKNTLKTAFIELDQMLVDLIFKDNREY